MGASARPSSLASDLINAVTIFGIGTIIEKPWGREFVLATEEVIIKVIQVKKDARTSLQYHQVKDEVITIIEGEGTIVNTPDDDRGRPRPSRPYRIRPGVQHRAVGPLVMVEITTPHNDDVVRISDDYGRSEP